MGTTVTYCALKSLCVRIVSSGLGEIKFRRMQGRHFLIEILDEELLEVLKQKDWSCLGKFFIKVELWSEITLVEERVSWIEVHGIPLHCWNYNSLKRLADVWGELLSLGDNLEKVSSLKKISMLVSISQLERIDEIIYLEVGKMKFPIRVVEMGLSKSKSVV